MDRILTLGDRDFDPSAPEPAGDLPERRSVKAVVLNDLGAVALLYSTVNNYHKLPGGGVEAGETDEEALQRELREEIGYKSNIVAELGEVVEDRAYRRVRFLSLCYLACVVGEPAPPQLTQQEANEGFEVRWYDSIAAAIQAVEADDTTDVDLGKSFRKKRELAILAIALAA